MKKEVARREIESLDYYLQNHTNDYGEESHTAMMMAVSALSENKGEWIADVDKWGDVVTTVNGYTCSKCGTFNSDKDNFCPNCGADMRGKAE